MKNLFKSLEKWERYEPSSFWLCSIVLYFSFSVGFSVKFPESPSKSEIVIEKNTASVLLINSGGGQEERNYFVPPTTQVPPNNPDNSGPDNSGNTGSHNYDPKPRYPWGIDPSYNPGGSSGSGSGSALPANQIPENDEWVTDPYVWDKVQDKDSSTSEEEEKIKSVDNWKDDVDFQYEFDSNGDPTLLVPNPGKARTKRNYNRVEFEQTASHMHHAPDFNVPLPSDFDMSHYMNLDRAGRIDYAKQKFSRESIISYQNEIGKSMCPLFEKKTISIAGFAGKYKQNTELTIQQTDTPNHTILSIIREDGLHISSYSVDDRALRQLTKDNFWVLKNRNL